VIQPCRVRSVGASKTAGGRGKDFVLYWMQASQRAGGNHALEFAVDKANELGKPLVVFFGLTEAFPEANQRHYRFMLEGLKETSVALEARGIRLIVRHVSPGEGAAELGRRACFVVVDRGYMRVERKWRRDTARLLASAFVEVESNVVVPVEAASPKEDFAAATLRPKILRQLESYLVPLKERVPKKSSLGLRMESLDIRDTEKILASLKVDGSVPAGAFKGGASRALDLLERFIDSKIDDYPEARNDPSKDGLSNLSPYLHFGQISPLEIALKVRRRGGPGAPAFLEQLIVRRELSINFVRYNPWYDAYKGLPDWCRATLAEHASVPRGYAYSEAEFEAARTHDPAWNAAQKELIITGKMHGTMRMYWGKKILEWSRTPVEGFKTALRLNNTYELDGRDPNGFAGVAWCFGKHDRPWPERPIFGMVRYMNESGLRRKFDVEAYVRKIAELEDKSQATSSDFWRRTR